MRKCLLKYKNLLTELYGEENISDCNENGIEYILALINSLGTRENFIITERLGLNTGATLSFPQITRNFNIKYPKLERLSRPQSIAIYKHTIMFLKRELKISPNKKSLTPISIEMFGLRLFNTLKRNKINYIEDLTKFTKKELINLDKIGPKQAKILVDILEENNIKLKEEIIEEEYSITT